MWLLTPDKKKTVQGFIVKLVNSRCPELAALIEGPRLETRVNLTVAVLVVPVESGRPLVPQVFTAVTKEFSTSGLALVVDGPKTFDEAIVGFRWEREMVFVRTTTKHLNPIGGGFYQLGLQTEEMVHAGDYPELDSLYI